MPAAAPRVDPSGPAGRTEPLIFIVAGEESGDRLGAALIEAIRARHGTGVTFAGIGGHAMAAQGVPSLFPIDELGIVGFSIVRQLPLILRRIRQAAAAAMDARPDVLVIIDSPDFTHRVARRVRAAAPRIPIVDYVSPSVWAWRPWRARAMRQYVDHVLALLPFEPAVHAELGGPPCTFVGHPSGERIATLRPSEQESQRRLADPPRVLVLPGSRRGEIRRMLPTFAQAVDRLDRQVGAIELVLPTVPYLADELRSATADWRRPPHIVVEAAEKLAAFRTARAALAKSGTVTLELALAGVPMVTGYKVSPLEEFVARRMIRVPSVILANLVLGENIVPEFLQSECNATTLADTLAPLLRDSAERRRQTEAFARLDAIMQIGTARPSDRAAEIVLTLAARGNG
jgi:lipid-A-disaccharide synthase